ncbi:two-component response regulator-like APRR1 [Primulina tabacum]|uniref:two-component response regulator-like APRR1 n=1 Tax=Primulina tabacum TaxID=48773 RepID=UPI003F5A9B4E
MENETGKSGDVFIDRSKVRILLCDNDDKSSEEVYTLLCKCSYQVISVRSPRQVIDALNAAGPDIDIIISEVDLPMSKGLKMLKYIMRDKELRRIPVIMMSAQDEVSIVVKCLKFGAADYLVKPLRTNELLNLWTHMWRRRRMLGLAEKSIVNCDLDLVASDPSDPNTNSTTLFSDDTDDRSLKGNNPEVFNTSGRGGETATRIETVICDLPVCQPVVTQISDKQTGQISSFLKKELKIGESSAFFTYIKSTIPNSTTRGPPSVHEDEPQHLKIPEHISMVSGQAVMDIQQQDITKTMENRSDGDEYHCSNSFHDSFFAERSCTPVSHDISQQRNSDEDFCHSLVRSGNVGDATGHYTHAAYPYYMPGVINQITMPPASMYQKHALDIHNHSNLAMLPPYNHIPQFPPHVQGMVPYPYYPLGICLQPGQMPAPAPHSWPSLKCPPMNEGKSGKVDRREAALMKFRQKRKERCFDKKIRYVNRKKLAERRPRLRGQFVRKVNGITVDLNGQPASAEEEEEDDEEYDEEENDS